MPAPVRQLLVLAAGFALGGMIANTPVGAALPAIDRAAMNSYANNYVCNGSNCQNTTFTRRGRWPGGSDCTNFLSQILRNGGLFDDIYWFYDKGGTPKDPSDDWWSDAWVSVQTFRGHFDSPPVDYLDLYLADKTNRYSPAYGIGGDLYAYNWGTGDGISHLGYSPGNGAFSHFKYNNSNNGNSSYVDPFYYDDYTSHGDWVNQHSFDRKKAPWNWGWVIEQEPTIRAAQRFYVLTWNLPG